MHSEPGMHRPHVSGTPVMPLPPTNSVAHVAQPPASLSTPQKDYNPILESILVLEREMARLRGKLPANSHTGAENQQTFVTARQAPGNSAQGRPAFRLDEGINTGAEIRAYPAPLPSANRRVPTAPCPHNQVTRVVPHGLYAAVAPVPGRVVAETFDSTHVHGMPSYAHLKGVPSIHPHYTSGRQDFGRTNVRCNDYDVVYARSPYSREVHKENMHTDYARPAHEHNVYKDEVHTDYACPAYGRHVYEDNVCTDYVHPAYRRDKFEDTARTDYARPAYRRDYYEDVAHTDDACPAYRRDYYKKDAHADYVHSAYRRDNVEEAARTDCARPAYGRNNYEYIVRVDCARPVYGRKDYTDNAHTDSVLKKTPEEYGDAGSISAQRQPAALTTVAPPMIRMRTRSASFSEGQNRPPANRQPNLGKRGPFRTDMRRTDAVVAADVDVAADADVASVEEVAAAEDVATVKDVAAEDNVAAVGDVTADADAAAAVDVAADVNVTAHGEVAADINVAADNNFGTAGDDVGARNNKVAADVGVAADGNVAGDDVGTADVNVAAVGDVAADVNVTANDDPAVDSDNAADGDVAATNDVTAVDDGAAMDDVAVDVDAAADNDVGTADVNVAAVGNVAADVYVAMDVDVAADDVAVNGDGAADNVTPADDDGRTEFVRRAYERQRNVRIGTAHDADEDIALNAVIVLSEDVAADEDAAAGEDVAADNNVNADDDDAAGDVAADNNVTAGDDAAGDYNGAAEDEVVADANVNAGVYGAVDIDIAAGADVTANGEVAVDSDAAADGNDGAADVNHGIADVGDGTADGDDGAADVGDGPADGDDGAANVGNGPADVEDGAVDVADGTGENDVAAAGDDGTAVNNFSAADDDVGATDNGFGAADDDVGAADNDVGAADVNVVADIDDGAADNSGDADTNYSAAGSEVTVEDDADAQTALDDDPDATTAPAGCADDPAAPGDCADATTVPDDNAEVLPGIRGLPILIGCPTPSHDSTSDQPNIVCTDLANDSAQQLGVWALAISSSEQAAGDALAVYVIMRNVDVPFSGCVHADDAGWKPCAIMAAIISCAGLASQGADVVGSGVDTIFCGELRVDFFHSTTGNFVVSRHAHVAQAFFLMLMPVKRVQPIPRLEELHVSQRGVNGFGSTSAAIHLEITAGDANPPSVTGTAVHVKSLSGVPGALHDSFNEQPLEVLYKPCKLLMHLGTIRDVREQHLRLVSNLNKKHPAADLQHRAHAVSTDQITGKGKVTPMGPFCILSVARNKRYLLGCNQTSDTPKSLSKMLKALLYPMHWHRSSAQCDMWKSATKSSKVHALLQMAEQEGLKHTSSHHALNKSGGDVGGNPV
ncbi:hypothetical protein H4R20_001405 [Coemansia guatemalensis]|uniref:Uncharacterized protein n=1 Tax=Coemansia guatemalensis TaxID=2761395 RepID=A0A9W8LVN5_9FUNG|nr:hypothetical protein H4R20_001405 [Coemansia guatemalensis]